MKDSLGYRCTIPGCLFSREDRCVPSASARAIALRICGGRPPAAAAPLVIDVQSVAVTSQVIKGVWYVLDVVGGMEPVETPPAVAHVCDDDTDYYFSAAAPSDHHFSQNHVRLLPLGAAHSKMIHCSLFPEIEKLAEEIAKNVSICVW